MKELPSDKISDHATISVLVSSIADKSTPIRTKIRSWKKYSKVRLQSELRWKLRDFHQCSNIDESANMLAEALEVTVNNMVELKEITVTETAPWYTSSLHGMKLCRDEAHFKFRTSRSQEDWKEYQRKRNNYVNAIRDAKKTAIQQELRASQSDSKKLWKSLKKLINPAKGTDNGVKFSDIDEDLGDKAKADKLNEYFIDSVKKIHDSIQECGSSDTGNDNLNPNYRWSTFKPIDMSRLRNTVLNLKKCGGINNVSTSVLIDAFEAIKHEFLVLINKSLSRGEFPYG